MIYFKTVRYKNFLSTGDKFTEIDLCKDKTTLIVGQNGSGKSTMLDAISFALFGKAHRNIAKPQLVNSVNKKGCVVEVEFDINKNSFKVVRSIKRSKFEIWKNGVLINQNSHNKEYQKVLEQNILKLNHKTFHQVVVLGSSSFIPFMQLSSSYRRNVIEDLLDINVFSKMNQILKEKYSTIKDEIRDNDYKIDISETKLESQSKYIRDITKINKEHREEKEASIEAQINEMFNLQNANEELLKKVDAIKPGLEKEQSKATKKIRKLNQYRADFQSKINSIVKDAKFFEENQSCPTCEQDIQQEVREGKLHECKSKAKELNDALQKVEEEGEATDALLVSIGEKLSEVQDMEIEVNSNNNRIFTLQKDIARLKSEIEEKESGDIVTAKEELEEIRNLLNTQRENKFTLNENLQYTQVILEMLKDTGIKTKIIKQYLPVINKLVNAYLQVLDFFVHFNLDENFDESIRSRHRDSFTYDSFSEGEKQRIDLALLFTWRQIAKMKNSVSTNLLVLDETFDSSLDQDGIENLMKILYTLGDDTNVFVISHKGDLLEGKFANKIEFVKHKNFSKVKG